MFIDNLKSLTNYNITNIANGLKNSRGVFTRDTLPTKDNNRALDLKY